MHKLNGYINKTIHLSNEDYTNAGVTQEEIKTALNRLHFVSWCENSGINHNVKVHLKPGYTDETIESMMYDIKFELDELLKSKV